MIRGVIFPELLGLRDDDVQAGPWTVREGGTARGSASCSLTERLLEVPLATSECARVVRAHELMHARVSPSATHLRRALEDVSPRALECAEEFRVNTLLARRGFDVGELRDGSEKRGGQAVGAAMQWGEAICFLVAVMNTGGERDFLTGLRRTRPEWSGALRAFRQRAHALYSPLPTGVLAATALDGSGLPSGYAASTLVLARLVTRSMAARVPVSSEELRTFRRSLREGARRPATGCFANLVVAPDSILSSVAGRGSRRRDRPATTGTTLRYPGRLLVDDQRRAFARSVAAPGGVVVVDLSGSMEVSDGALARLVRSSPQALVVGYSHRPGDLGTTPNAWTLVQRGRVASTLPTGNVGNGVDGPALRWALSQRRGDEPVVWITDGQVTDSHDHPDTALSAQCAELVRRHRIRLVRSLDEAAVALRRRTWEAGSWAAFGRVGRELAQIAGRK